MAKKKRMRSVQRVTSPIASRSRLLGPALSPLPSLSVNFSPAPVVDDRRAYHPLADYRPALTIDGRPAPVQRKAVTSRFKPLPLGREITAFAVPKTVSVCVRRGVRREVMFAKRLTRKGSSARRSRNFLSSVSCR